MSESSQSVIQEHGFNKFQQFFWPVHKSELKKFLPMSFLMFCILFVYTMIRDLKDVFIQTYAAAGGPEVLSCIKLFFVLPFAFLVVMFYTFLVNKFGFNKAFYVIISIYICFFAIFTYILFPNYTHIHPGIDQVRAMQSSWPGFLYHIIPAITNWSFTLFYMMAEIWGTMAISSLFWRFANEITMKNEVKRFFGMYALIANIGTFASGSLLTSFSQVHGDRGAFNRNVMILISIGILLAIVTLIIFRYLTTTVMNDPKMYNPEDRPQKKKKQKVSALDGIKILFSDRYLLLIAVLVVCYGLSDNLFEVVWKAGLLKVYPSSHDYSAAMGIHSQCVAVFTMLSTFIAAWVLRKFKWKTGAIITPLMILTISALFFALVIYNGLVSTNVKILGVTTGALVAAIGIVGVAIFKAIKYTLFDPTKSMAYIPLDDDTKTKGQSAVEVIGGRAGKSGGAAVTYVLTNVVSAGSKVGSHIFTIIPIILIALFAWNGSVLALGKKYEKKLAEEHEKE